MSNTNIARVICLIAAVPALFFGKLFPVVGAPVLALLFGIILCTSFPQYFSVYKEELNKISKKTLQLAVILLGFGLNLNVVFKVGRASLPIILATISISLIIAFVMCKILNIPVKTATLIGVGSSICGGSAIAATAPVIHAESDDVAQSISVIFLFNLLAALIFPTLGAALGMNDYTFALFAGTAINDTSSVTAAASSWDAVHQTGTMVLDTATVVKLTRTLAIIPITFILSLYYMKKEENLTKTTSGKYTITKLVPRFIIFFILCSCLTSLLDFILQQYSTNDVLQQSVRLFFSNMKRLSKFLIVLAMTAIGLNTGLAKLLKSGVKTILLGLSCWIGIILVSLFFLG